MSPYNEAARNNLLAGIEKMRKTMTPAAQVRREFRLGRPPKPVETLEPMQRTVVWRKATEALANLRARMTAAKLNPSHVDAAIVYVEASAPDEARVLLVDGPNRSADEWRDAAFEQLGRDDVIVLGMIFKQYDELAGNQAIFPHQFSPLNARGLAVLRQAAEARNTATAFLKTKN